MSERREVRVGEEHFVLRPFRGFKALLILERVTALMEVAPELQDAAADALKAHRDKYMVEMPRNVFEMRYPEEARDISEKGWSEAGQSIRLPDPEAPPVDGAAVFLSLLPKLVGLARSEMLELLALVVVKDSALRDADENDTTDELLASQGKTLLYDGSLEELAELGLAAFELIQEQFSGKVRELVSQATSLMGGESEDDPLPIPEPAAENESEMVEGSSETSFISSPESTDGPEPTPSGTGGMTSLPSPTGSGKTVSPDPATV